MLDLLRNFEQHEAAIADYIKSAIGGYYSHECYRVLDGRLNRLQDSNDLMPQSLQDNYFVSQVVFPIVKERSSLRRAITAANYRASDIFVFDPIGATSAEQAADAELILNLNMDHTHFKMRTLKPGIDTASKFGTCVMYTFWKVTDSSSLRTTHDPKTGSYERIRTYNTQKNADNVEVGLRDYFQNPDIPDPDSSDYQGHIRPVHITELVTLMDDETYIAPNLYKVIEKLKKGDCQQMRGKWDEKTLGKFRTEMSYFEGMIPISGNEDGTQRYRVQMVGGEIIRLSVDDYDQDMRSYSVLNFDKRKEYWWGNPDSEYVAAHEDFLNTFLSLSADNALRSMQQYIFFQRDSISPTDIHNAISNNNFVPVDVKNANLSQLIKEFQPGSLNLGPAQFITQMVNDSVQKMSTKVDLSRKSEAGGVQNNSTATAANILAGQSDVLESDILENFNFGVEAVGLRNLILLQQFLSEIFYVKPKPQDTERAFEKYQILGDMKVQVNSTASKNKQNELLRMQNLATWLLNITMNPQMQQAGYNVAPMVRDILQKAELPSVDEIIPKENEVMAAPGMVPSNPMQQQPQIGGQGAIPQIQMPQ